MPGSLRKMNAGLVTNNHIARCHGVYSGWSLVS